MNDEILIDLNNVFPDQVSENIPDVEITKESSLADWSDDSLLAYITKHVQELKQRITDATCDRCKDRHYIQYTADTWLKETVERQCPSCHGASGGLRRKYYALTRFE